MGLRNRILLILFMASAWPCGLSADTLTLKSGQTIQGTVIERNDRLIRMDVGLKDPITYYSDEIENIAAQAAAAPSSVPSSSGESPADQANRAEQEGLELIDQGKMEEGLAHLREAVHLDPQANRHLNLGSILFGNGVALQKKGQLEEAKPILAEAEHELQQAVKMFDPDGETTFISEGYSLLGELSVALQDKDKAKTYYEKSLSYYENPSAKRGLAGL